MGAERYEVVIVNAKTGRETLRQWGELELLKGLAWLKRMNVRGGDIYLRPLDGPELMLVDTLDAAALKDMYRQGLAPTVAIEISPGRFEVWVKLFSYPLPEGLRRPAISGLARLFPKVVKYGRLAGFTNQSVEPNEGGRQPYVLSHQATGTVAPTVQLYLAAIERHRRELAAEEQRQVDAQKAKRIQHRHRGPSR